MFGSDDITWCMSNCNNKKCFRHPSNMNDKTGLHSYADFKGTPDCVMGYKAPSNNKKKNIKVTTEERGWAGHFIASSSCLFRRNTLVTCGDIKWVVSTVGALPSLIDIPELGIEKGQMQSIGHERWYETMVFESLYDEYNDADVTKQIEFESEWGIWGKTWKEVEEKYGSIPDIAANKMHDTVVKEIKEKIKETYNAKTSNSV